MWPKLKVDNGHEVVLSGLAKNKKFRDLSQKRITKCVRETLRAFFENRMIEVSCSAQFDGIKDEWTGRCEIDATPHSYRIVLMETEECS